MLGMNWQLPLLGSMSSRKYVFSSVLDIKEHLIK